MDDEPDLVQEVWRGLLRVGEDVADTVTKWTEEAQYEVDKQVGKFLAQHPELYADVRRTWRRFQKAVDKALR